MTLRALLATSLIFVTGEVLAAQKYDVKPNQELSVNISIRDINRIKIENDRIRLIRYNAGTLEISEDQILGEIFISASSHSPTSLYLTTEKNHTYKVTVFPKDIPGEQIFLKPVEPIISELKTNEPELELIKAMISGLDLEGFKSNWIETEIEIGAKLYSQKALYVGRMLQGMILECPNDDIRDLLSNEAIMAYSIDEIDEKNSRLFIVLGVTDERFH